jgi:ATP-dependent Lon protease
MPNDTALPTDVTTLPLLPLRDVVVFPHMVIPLFVGRPKSIKALDVAMDAGKHILLVAQKQASKDDPTAEDLYDIGSVATVLQMLKLPDGTVKVLVEGTQRARIQSIEELGEYLAAEAQPIAGEPGTAHEVEAMRRALLTQFDQYVKLNKKIPPEILTSMSGIDDGGRLADAIAAHLPLKLEQKQQILEMSDVGKRLEHLLGVLEGEVDILQVEKRIRGRVKRQMEKSQREYYLNEQVKAIQKELGEGDENADLEEMEKKIKAARMSREAEGKAMAELKKLRMMSPMSAEATVVRNYIDTLLGLPWRKKSKISKDLANAVKVLDADHYGLEKVKERIVEYLAVQQRVDRLKAPILCLVGPPGVGKTSLGQSVAKATGRKFVRMSLGGVRDEAEIRGHRRTYIGSMPGKILQNMTKVAVRNPLFLLDEVDKMGQDFRGDPSSALLEVLDPEQNNTFVDHYVEVEYDLSDVMFVATANTMNIPAPLLDRMEVIRLSGYTEDEKIAIAKQYLLPKQIKNNGLKPEELHVAESALRDIVRYYTREAGVRSLERDISKICRKVVKGLLLKQSEGKVRKGRGPVDINSKNLDRYLGVRRYTYGIAERKNQIGQVNGPRMDRGRRRLADHRVGRIAGQGQDDDDRQARRRDERIDRRSTFGRAQSFEAARHTGGLLHEDRSAHPLAGRCNAEGRAVGGCCDRHGDRLDPHRNSGALRRRDDGRDHAARRSAADRRLEREAACSGTRRHQDGADTGRERERPGRDTRRDQESARHPSGALDRAGARTFARASAGADRRRDRQDGGFSAAGGRRRRRQERGDQALTRFPRNDDGGCNRARRFCLCRAADDEARTSRKP